MFGWNETRFDIIYLATKYEIEAFYGIFNYWPMSRRVGKV